MYVKLLVSYFNLLIDALAASGPTFADTLRREPNYSTFTNGDTRSLFIRRRG